jgi:hypothetical protein
VDNVLVITADLRPLHRVSMTHAIRMLCRQAAVLHEAEPDDEFDIYPVPRVVRLVRHIPTQRAGDGRPPRGRAPGRAPAAP